MMFLTVDFYSFLWFKAIAQDRGLWSNLPIGQVFSAGRYNKKNVIWQSGYLVLYGHNPSRRQITPSFRVPPLPPQHSKPGLMGRAQKNNYQDVGSVFSSIYIEGMDLFQGTVSQDCGVNSPKIHSQHAGDPCGSQQQASRLQTQKATLSFCSAQASWGHQEGNLKFRFRKEIFLWGKIWAGDVNLELWSCDLL